jgi:recombination protein U
MAVNRGKDFEDEVRKALEKIDGLYVERLYDPQGGYAGVANPCDFICYKRPQFYMLECKSTHENTMAIYSPNPKRKYGMISNTQWEDMLAATQYGAVAGVICWWIERDVTRFLPIQELEKIRNSGAKSVRYDANVPNSLEIAGTKKRIYFDYDFTEFFQRY